MSDSVWSCCSVCAGEYEADPETGKTNKILYRCITCSDQAYNANKDGLESSIHLCSTCHKSSVLYHPSSHCWAKIFLSPAKGAYCNRKGSEWLSNFKSLISSFISPSLVGSDTGLSTIHDVSHYMPCTKCSQAIYGTRWISCQTKLSFCSNCYSKSDNYDTEEVWIMRTSIFHGLPATGPLMHPVTAAEEASKKVPATSGPGTAGAADNRPRAPVGFGFGAPKPAVVRITVPGENYSDYVNDDSSSPKPATQGPVSFVDDGAESYTEEGALNMKRSSAYYDDETPGNPVRVTISSSFGISLPGTASNLPSSDSYAYQSSPSSYQDDSETVQSLSHPPPPALSYTNDSESGYTDESTTDSSSVTIASYSDGITPPQASLKPTSPAGYSDDSLSKPPNNGYSGGYSDSSSSTGYGARDVPSARLGPGAYAGGYSDQAESTALSGYSDDAPAPANSGYADGNDVGPQPLSDGAYAGGYSDQNGSLASGYTNESTGYTDGSINDSDPLSKAQPASYSGGASVASYGYGYGVTVESGPKDPFSAPSSNSGYAATGSQTSGSYGYAEASDEPQDSVVGYAETGGGYSGADETGGYTEPVKGGPSKATPKGVTPTPGGPPVEADGSRDWNAEFQLNMARFKMVMAQETPAAADILIACRDLYSLSGEFIDTAQEIGRTIIEEVSIPAPAKTVRPVNVGGVAGGEKYVQRGIFFKFAIDAFGVYGGDEYAQKAAGHELAGLKAYYNCQIEGLNTPFMLLMDYRGYRLIATTKLPIGGSSLIYGSADGGITVHKDNPTMNEMMQKAASILNIKPHVVGMRNQTDLLYAPTDIEGHLGTDGRYYVLDTARICPPEPIHKSFTAVVLPPEEPFPAVLSNFKLWKQRRDKNKPTSGEFWSPWPAPREVGLTTERWMDQIHAHLGVTNTGTITVSSEEFEEGLLYHIKESGSFAPHLAPRNRTVNVRASNLVKKAIYGPAILVLRGRKGAQLFNLLRYETVKQSTVPLSSDAFTPFGKHSRDLHNEEVDSCFYNILSSTIPKFLKTDQLFPHAAGALKAIQKAGINTRMIGFLRSNIADNFPNATRLRVWILNEMIVRVTKNYLRAKLRRATSKLKPIEPIIIKRFNLLLGDSVSSTFFWATEMKAQIVNKFGRNGQALTPHELKVDVDLRASINKLALFQLLQSKIGVIFTEEANGRFHVDPMCFEVPAPLTEKDLSKLVVLKKSLLQPDLDELILATASKSAISTEQLLEMSGSYLPGAETHPALALQRLHIAEKLVLSIFDSLGFSYNQNWLYTSNVTPNVHSTESRAAYRPTLNPKAAPNAAEIYNALDTFLDALPEYKELLSHLAVLDLWVESTPYCPMEISCKLFYLRGCLAMIHRSWGAAESFLKTSYDAITSVGKINGLQTGNFQNAYVSLDNDRPFSIMILDKLVRVMLSLDRHAEALAYAQKFVQHFAESTFPGSLDDLKELFGASVPVSFGVYRTYYDLQTQTAEFLNKIETSLLDKKKSVDGKVLRDWISRVTLTNFTELSGFFMSPGVLQHYLDERAYRKTVPVPHIAKDQAPCAPRYRGAPRDKISIHLSIPCTLIAGVHDVSVSYTISSYGTSSLAELPYKIVFLQNVTYLEMTQDPFRAYFINPSTIVASVEIPDPSTYPIGTATFEQVNLTVGQYMCLVTTAKGTIVSQPRYIVSQVMYVCYPEDSTNFLMAHDLTANHWNRMTDLPCQDIVSFSICDRDTDKYDGKNSPAKVELLDLHGKIYWTDCHNWTGAPPCLLRNYEQFVLPSWALANDLFAWKVTKIAVSMTHSLILTDNGELLSVGSNQHGALGHGDTVTLGDPRLVRKLKGKPITQIVAGVDRSMAIDEFGGLYHWGKGFTSLPELHPYFSGKSKASKGVKISIAKAVFQGFQPTSINYRSNESTFFDSNPVGYISTEGKAYLWCANQRIFPESEEYAPELVLEPKEPMIDMAINANAVAFVTAAGEVWTAGSNTEGELGCGVGSVKRRMAKGDYRADVPYSCAEKVDNLQGHFITRVDGCNTFFFALSDQAEFFKWGGSSSWSPTIPVQLRGLKVVDYTCGMRGMVCNINQAHSLPLPHPALCFGSDDAFGVSKAPTASGDGREFGVAYHDLDQTPNFSVIISVPKTQLSGNYCTRFVRPNQSEPISAALSEVYLSELNNDFQATVTALYDVGKWGSVGHSGAPTWDQAPPIPTDTDFQVLIIHKVNENAEIKYRSQTFRVRKSEIAYSLKIHPARPKPREIATFTLSPVRPNTLSHFVVIRAIPSGQLTGVVPINGTTVTYEPFSIGNFRASWEYTTNPSEDPTQLFTSVEFEVGEPVESRPVLKLEILPPGPYYCGQSVIVDWAYTKNPPGPGSHFFGGLYPAEDQTVTALMSGGYISLAEASGTSSICLPAQKANYELRCWHVSPTSGMVKLASAPFPVTIESAAAAAAIAADIAAAPSLETPVGFSSTDPQPSYLDLDSLEDVSTDPSPDPLDWESFFVEAGIDKSTARGYTKVFNTGSFPISKVHLLDGGVLCALKITSIPHQIMILERVDKIRQNRLQAFIQQQILTQIALLAPSLD